MEAAEKLTPDFLLDDDFKLIALQKLDAIRSFLYSNEAKVRENSIGALSGIGGQMLFHLSVQGDCDKRDESLVQLIHRGCEIINGGNIPPGYCGGLAGFGWSLDKLVGDGYVDAESLRFFTTAENYLKSSLVANINAGDLDFLHGGTGILYYFLSKPELTDVSLLEGAITRIKEISIQDESTGGIYWLFLNRRGAQLPNLSLSHGMSSLIIILTMYYEKGIMKDDSENLVESAVKYILGQRNPSSMMTCYPGWIVPGSEKQQESRLAWCYGDICIAICLIHVGEVFKREDWIIEGVNILLATTNRVDARSESVVDASLCHGACGIAVVYKHYWQKYGNLELQNASQYWIKHALKNTNEDSLAGYKYWSGEKLGYQENYSVLEGVIGYGLSLASALGSADSKWLRSLLIF